MSRQLAEVIVDGRAASAWTLDRPTVLDRYQRLAALRHTMAMGARPPIRSICCSRTNSTLLRTVRDIGPRAGRSCAAAEEHVHPPGGGVSGGEVPRLLLKGEAL